MSLDCSVTFPFEKNIPSAESGGGTHVIRFNLFHIYNEINSTRQFTDIYEYEQSSKCYPL